MHFGLNDDQQLLQATLREYAAKELLPARRREIFEAGRAFDPGLWQSAADVGVTGLVIPQRYGGAGLELLDLALAFEVLGEAAMPGPFLGHALAALALLCGGSAAQRERWLPRLASGDALGSVALCELEGGWGPETWGVREADGRLHGAKQHVEHAERADLLVVGVAGGGLVLVEGGAEGVSTASIDGIDRMRNLSRVEFVGTPAEPLPGGVEAARRVRDAGCVLLAADAFGAAWKLIRLTVEYSLTREQFGTPIAQFQSVKHQLANLAADTEPTRGLFWYAAHAFDHLPAEAEHAAAVAKAHVTDRAVQVGRGAVELHGGIGFTWECDVQFWVRRCMFDRAWLGLPREHLARVADLGGW
ncbi:MAG: acyl-CoA/acyl-ACP dehydrogenase [Deltaproteobacteria bacterium]|nr:acyl-CoA/acyl-ACP dehydrogenase [Deltaproteobacteria bacterium]